MNFLRRLFGKKLSGSGAAISAARQAQTLDGYGQPAEAALEWLSAAELWSLEALACGGIRRTACVDMAETCLRSAAVSCDRAADRMMWTRHSEGSGRVA